MTVSLTAGIDPFNPNNIEKDHKNEKHHYRIAGEHPSQSYGIIT
jgi:hypothetical protein